MIILDTTQLPDDLPNNEVYWAYNGFDCMVTYEIRDKLRTYLDPTTTSTYRRTLELQAPYLEMMLRGTRLDIAKMAEVRHLYLGRIRILESWLARLCIEGLGLPSSFNWRSPLQLKNFFYGVLALKEIKKRNANGLMTPATDRETLEKLKQYFTAIPFVNTILALRDLGKAVSFLETKLDDDKRIRCNFNLAGTNTGRLSSSFSDMGTGTNLQNIDRELKYVFIPDNGRAFINIDLEQADSRNVGALAWEMFYHSHGAEYAGAYLDACESGDLHTTVCRMAWRDLDWGDDPARWRSVADQIAYRGLTYRDMAKKLGHGTNYLGQPKTMSVHTKVPQEAIELFQARYFEAFPCVRAWQQRTIELLQQNGSLTHLFGRRRFFFSRLDEQTTINAAIANCPQGMTGDQINVAALNIWRYKQFQMLLQVHDSLLFQTVSDRLTQSVPLALSLARAPVTLSGNREFCVPVEAKTGWNWGDVSPSNPFGMAKWKGADNRNPPRVSSNNRVALGSYL